MPLVYAWPLAAFCALLALSGAWLALFAEREAESRRRNLARRMRNEGGTRLPGFTGAGERWCEPAAIRRGGMTRIGLGLAGIAMLLPTLAGVYWP